MACAQPTWAGALRRGCPTVIVGEVAAGQRFTQPFGGGLEFVLDPTRQGWVVRIEPLHRAVPGPDFAEVATLPFRSVNPLLLTTDFGFRAQDVIGWNPRSFRYLQSPGQFARARRAYDEAVSATQPSPAQTAEVAAVVDASREGRLEILDARLVPGTGDQSPAASLLATHLLTTPHILADATAANTVGRVEWLRFRATLGGVPAVWATSACRSSK